MTDKGVDKTQDDVGCIVGAVIQVKPDKASLVRERLKLDKHIEIHAEDEQSRWVITLEAETSKKVLKLSEDIQNMQGVLSLMPVYQHCEENQNIKQNDGGWIWR
ncbi:MAG: chaperone NapD [Ghiorsea sp.]|nr:chaperone NapD [Ghiorsea sp.]